MLSFLRRKNIVFSAQRYLVDALSSMALGLFSSLLIGLILKTLGEQTALVFGSNEISAFFVEAGTYASSMMGAAIGVAVSSGLQAPPLVLFCGVITGHMGAALGGPAGAFVAAAAGAEAGKLVAKETKLDILITPATCLLVGLLAARSVGPGVSSLMNSLGRIIMEATEMQPILMGIIVSVVMGLVLTAPISSAALAIMLNLSGLAAGAATVGCCAQMIGFAVISWRDNGIGGFLAQGIGTSMLQVSNIIKNPWILVPPTLAGALLGPFASTLAQMTNLPSGAGMGTSGLVGQITTITDMGGSTDVLIKIGLLHFLLPALLSWAIAQPLRRTGLIKSGDLKLNL